AGYQLDESVWARIGLVPTKKDLERSVRDYKKAIHAATKASFEALGFRLELPKEEKKADNASKPAEKPEKKPAEMKNAA
ncbi:MAG: hypothetical protein LBB84_07845, partial [Tannerellaceae bacterium]|nr:hypothetical protein [Tannerellaceae bacterium]